MVEGYRLKVKQQGYKENNRSAGSRWDTSTHVVVSSPPPSAPSSPTDVLIDMVCPKDNLMRKNQRHIPPQIQPQHCTKQTLFTGRQNDSVLPLP